MRQVTHTEVLKELTTMRNDSSTGPDQIPAKYLKLVAEYIASPLMHIINSFISCQRFPDAWKQARVSPIPKITIPTEADHFRPISILSVLSKVYERLVLHQLLINLHQPTKCTKHQYIWIPQRTFNNNSFCYGYGMI